MTNHCATDQTGLESYPALFKHQPVSKSLKVSVILPVRNEEENLTKTLDALRGQVNPDGKPLFARDYEVLLLANNCTDRSVAIARVYQERHPEFSLHIEDIELPKSIAHIGTVRRLLMDAAYDRFERIAKPSGIIASTDSDSEVDKLWIFQTLKEMQGGNDVVGGRIFTKPSRSISRLYYLRDITYKHLVSRLEDILDPVVNDRWPRHFQCFGASFAVTCRIYDRCGRLPAVPFLEDMAFHRSLVRIDAKIRLSPFVQVFTSDRIEGRVDFGLSIQLKQWGEMNEHHHPLMVEPAGSLIIKLNTRRQLRALWASKADVSEELAKIASALGLDFAWTMYQFQNSAYFGTLWQTIEDQLEQQGWSVTWPPADIVQVIPALKREISMLASELQSI